MCACVRAARCIGELFQKGFKYIEEFSTLSYKKTLRSHTHRCLGVVVGVDFGFCFFAFVPLIQRIIVAKRKVNLHSYICLVDPASSHMLVSKTKPCMSKYNSIYMRRLRISP